MTGYAFLFYLDRSTGLFSAYEPLSSSNNLVTFPPEDWTIERHFIDMGHKKEFNSNWQLNINLTFNGMKNTDSIIGGSGRFFTTN